MTKQLKPLYITVHMDGCPVSRVLVDNGDALNVMPITMLKVLGKTEEDVIPTDVSMSGFAGGVTETKGCLPVELTVGRKKVMAPFFLIERTESYLERPFRLGRDWVHRNWCVPSSLHQLLLFCLA